MGLIFSRVPVWVWALVALLAYGGFQHHQAAAAAADLLRQKTWAAELEHERALLAEGAAEAERVKRAKHDEDIKTERAQFERNGVVVATVLGNTIAERDRLRIITAAYRASAVQASASATTGRGADGSAAAIGPIFDECAGQLVSMGQQAEDLGIRLRGLQAWAASTVSVCGE